VRERLKLHYGEKATLQVERRAEAGTRARIVIRDTHEPIRLSAENQE
jgi:sensor histidine kinase YesM